MPAVAQGEDADPVVGEVIELNEIEVLGRSGDAPGLVFNMTSPRLAYYTPPKLPFGGLILALDFIDRYRENPVPGPRKWAGIVYFPWIDGYGRAHDQWLCLYLWNGQMYGFSPEAGFEEERRFALALPFEERKDPVRLLALAESYIERVAPGGEEPYYVTETYGSIDEDGFVNEVETLEFNEIEPGRIAAVRSYQIGKEAIELVAMPYQYLEDPNPLPVADGEMGPAPKDPNAKFDWGKLFDLSLEPDPFEVARALLLPRWCQRAEIHWSEDILFFKDVRRKARVLLFNIGLQIYAYHPRYGVWRTEATLPMLRAGLGSNLITYPGGVEPERVLILPWKD